MHSQQVLYMKKKVKSSGDPFIPATQRGAAKPSNEYEKCMLAQFNSPIYLLRKSQPGFEYPDFQEFVQWIRSSENRSDDAYFSSASGCLKLDAECPTYACTMEYRHLEFTFKCFQSPTIETCRVICYNTIETLKRTALRGSTNVVRCLQPLLNIPEESNVSMQDVYIHFGDEHARIWYNSVHTGKTDLDISGEIYNLCSVSGITSLTFVSYESYMNEIYLVERVKGMHGRMWEVLDEQSKTWKFIPIEDLVNSIIKKHCRQRLKPLQEVD